MRGERLRVLERSPDVVPAAGGPDLRVVARPDDHDVSRQRGILAEVARQDDPTLTVELDLGCPAEDVPLEGAGCGVCQGKRRGLRGRLPFWWPRFRAAA